MEFLFNVETDDHESKNLINSHPDKANTMKKLLENWDKNLHHPGIPKEEIGREKRWYDHYFKEKIK